MNLSHWLAYRRERGTYAPHRHLLRPFPAALEAKTPEQLLTEYEAMQSRYAAMAQMQGQVQAIAGNDFYSQLGRLIGWK